MSESESLFNRLTLSVLLIIGFIIAASSVFGSARLWFVGHEETAVVIRLDHTSWAKYAGKGFHYDLEASGRKFKLSSSGPIELGTQVQILVDPLDVKTYQVGGRQSGFFMFLLGSGAGESAWLFSLKVIGALILVLLCPFAALYLLLSSSEQSSS